MQTPETHTIVAQCTPQGSGAIALLRVSGSQAWDIVAACSEFPGNKNFISQPTHTVHFGWVVDEYKQRIDQVLFIAMRGPKTFTGEDTVEITCHNNQIIVEAVIAQLLIHGAQAAQPGEFTRRAYDNKKLDLVQAEAINELICANTQATIKKSLAQLEGSFSQWITTLETQLVKAIAWCEASFEFLDEGGDFSKEIAEYITLLLANIHEIKKTFNAQNHIRQGIRIALVGTVNAGKSSLFNMLLNQKRAIVSPTAGTTRDSIEASVVRNGIFWTLIDTAGLRTTDDSIEREGIQRTFAEAQSADALVLVYDGSRELTAQEQSIYNELHAHYAQKILSVINKADALAQQVPTIGGAHAIHVSAHTQQGLDTFEQALEQLVTRVCSTCATPFLVNQRHYQLLINLEQKLIAIQPLLTGYAQYELISLHLQQALECMSELTGKTVSEAALDAVFKEFCVGK